MRISDWSSDVCSSDLRKGQDREHAGDGEVARHRQGVHAADGKGHQSQQVTEQYEHEERKDVRGVAAPRSEEHTSELQSLMRISYAVFCLKKKTKHMTLDKEIQTYIVMNHKQGNKAHYKSNHIPHKN